MIIEDHSYFPSSIDDTDSNFYRWWLLFSPSSNTRLLSLSSKMNGKIIDDYHDPKGYRNTTIDDYSIGFFWTLDDYHWLSNRLEAINDNTRWLAMRI